MADVTLVFQVECSSTKPGDGVFVVGSLPELGAWDPSKAVACITSKQHFPVWSSPSVELPASAQKFEFKILVQPADGKRPQAATWEGGRNRSLHLPKSVGGQVQLTASCSWGKPEVQCHSQLDAGSSKVDGKSTSKSKPPPTTSVSTSSMPRVDTGANWLPIDEDGETFDDTVPELNVPPARTKSGLQSGSGGPGPGGLSRRSSRHLVFNLDGTPNLEITRKPSMMLIDPMELVQECTKHQKEVEEMDRDRDQLNVMQRRMQSMCLLEEMRKITSAPDPSRTVLLQGFNWESWRAGGGDWYSIVGNKVDMLGEMGVTDVWLPPCSASVAEQGYLPSQLFNLDGSKYGSQASLQALLEKLHSKGMRGVADIVINHRCGDKQDSQGRWNQFTTGMVARPSFAGVMDWGGWAITLGDRFSDGTGLNRPGSFDGKFDAAPDIDHANEKVQQSISIWLRWLRLQVGFDAWRFDFVKGYAAKYVGHYCRKSEPAWAVGELWGDMQYDDNGLCHNQDKHRQDLCNWINATDKTSTAFDFTTKGILQEACRNCEYWRLRDRHGKPPGLLGWMPKYAVTFIDNHDTGSTQRHWPFPDDKVLVGYAYILTHPGIPCLFWDHVMDWGEDHRRKIADLLKARRESGILVDAPVNIQCADRDLYLAEVGSPPCLRVALGPRCAGEPDRGYWSEGPAGRGYRIWLHRPPREEPSRAPVKERKVVAPKSLPAQEPVHVQTKEVTVAKAPAPAVDTTSTVPVLSVDGAPLTPERLRAMTTPGLEKLSGLLEQALRQTREALETAQGQGS